MKKTLTLKRPIIINGTERTELSYDVEAITTDQYLKACSKAAESDRGMMSKLKQKENDYALHMYLGYEAIIACNPEIDYEDLKRASGFDVLSFTAGGSLKGEQLRRAVREFGRTFNAGIIELRRMRLIDFLTEYGEAAEEAAAERKRIENLKRTKAFKRKR